MVTASPTSSSKKRRYDPHVKHSLCSAMQGRAPIKPAGMASDFAVRYSASGATSRAVDARGRQSKNIKHKPKKQKNTKKKGSSPTALNGDHNKFADTSKARY